MSAPNCRDRAALAILEAKLKQNEETQKRLDFLNVQLDDLRKNASAAGEHVLHQLVKIQTSMEIANPLPISTKPPSLPNKNVYDITLPSSSSVYFSRSDDGTRKIPELTGKNGCFYECADVSMGVKVQMEKLRLAADALEALSVNPVVQKGGLNDEAMALREELRRLYEKMSRKTKGLHKKGHMCIACGNCG